MQKLLLNLYNTSMKIGASAAEQGTTLTDTDKAMIIDSIGALLESIGIANFNGTYSLDQLKTDIERCL